MMKLGGFIAAIFVVLFMAGTAEAGTREDVLAGAIRCGGVGPDRQWLDCYYGSAQPMRAQLRLSPAPQSQPQGVPQGGAMGGVRQDVLSGAIRCGGLGDDRQWLDCYYGAAQPMRAQLGLSPAPQAQLAMVPGQNQGAAMPLPVPAHAPLQASAQPAYAPRQPPAPSGSMPARLPPSPGFWDGLFGDDPVVLKTQLASYSLDKDGFFTATLANGQTWRQVSGAPNARWPHAPSTYHVTITRGMMRTFNFRVEGDPSLYKVKLIR